MKRSGPLRRSAGLRRSSGLRSVSRARRAQVPVRDEVRRAVIARDRGCVAEGIAGVPHGPAGGRFDLEVHELARGAGRGSAWLDVARAVSLCPAAHDWTTAHPEGARARGLAVRSWADGPAFAEAERVRRSWQAGLPMLPDWWDGPFNEER